MDFCDRVISSHARFLATMHCIMNHAIEVDEDAGTGNGEIYNVTYESLKRLDMWCVGDILWPTPAVIRCAGEGEPEKVTPNYINMFFQPF